MNFTTCKLYCNKYKFAPQKYSQESSWEYIKTEKIGIKSTLLGWSKVLKLSSFHFSIFYLNSS